VRKTFATVALTIAIASLPSVAWAQPGAQCAPTYQGQKVQVGASVQLEDGSWVTVTDPKMCMGDSLEAAAANAAAEAGSTSVSAGTTSTSAASTAASGSASNSAAAPTGAPATGFGGLADFDTGIPVPALLVGGLIAATLGAIVARRRSA
jgi:hypothetical protein